MSTLIQPYPGQIVWYWPMRPQRNWSSELPFAAMVCHVFENGRVSVVIYDDAGMTSRHHNVRMVTDRKPQSGEFSYTDRDVQAALSTPCTDKD